MRIETSADRAEVPGLRERNKASRREALLEAALGLLDHHDATDVSAETIARTAGLSTATLYNLVGGRDELFVALVDRLAESILRSSDSERPRDLDPIQAARRVLDRSVDALTARSAAYRQIALSFGMRTQTLHTAADPSLAVIEMIWAAQEQGILRSDAEAEPLGRQVYVSFNGALFRWAVGGLTDRGLRLMAHHGLLCVVCATATERHTDVYRRELVKIGQELAPEYRRSPL